jgi:hypothetical protein
LGEVFGLSPPRALSQLDKRVRFRLDQAIVGAGWHGVEQDPRGESLRWSGPGNKSDLHLPLIIDIDCSIRLHVPFGVPFGVAEAGVSLFVNGIAVKVHLTRNRGGDWTIQAVMRAEQVLEAGPLTVTLNVERMVKPAEFDGSSDTRVLGVPVSWIEVEPA